MKIVKNLNQLNKPCKKVTPYEGSEIASQLLDECMENDNYIGLAANQVGIDAAVAVVAIPDMEPITLINPEILEVSNPVVYKERCLSLPKKVYNTKRFQKIKIRSDNLGEQLYDAVGKGEAELLQVVCIQHEINHLDGLTIKDVRFIPPSPKKEFPKIGRNQWVQLTHRKTKEERELKYKKAELLLTHDSDWEITGIQEKS